MQISPEKMETYRRNARNRTQKRQQELDDRAVARLLDLDPDIEVNLAPAEDVYPKLRIVIDTKGVEL